MILQQRQVNIHRGPDLLAVVNVLRERSKTLLEMADKSIRGVQRVIQVTEQPPLVVIPLITTPAEEIIARRNLILMAGALTAAAIASILAVHFMYMPLDLLSQKAMHRWGLG